MNLENCEFDDFCVSSWLIANLRFVDCSFNEKLKFTKCQITNIELNHNIIRESFSLENTSQTNTSLTICFTRIERAVRIKGKFHQIDLTNISTAKLDFSSLKIQGETNFLKVANDNEEPQIQGYENQIQQFSIRQSEIGAKVDFKNMNCKDIQILNCTFIEGFNFRPSYEKMEIIKNVFENNVCFDNTHFSEIRFHDNIFVDEANFRSCQFENNASFSHNIFKHNVYFNNSTFKAYVDLNECEFEKGVSFYGVSFEKAPNFSACYFKDKSLANLVSLNIDKLDFAKVEKYINDNFKDQAFLKEEEFLQDDKKLALEQKYRLKCAQNAKDSFRAIKDVLISQNNILEAQEWHKLELYSKEKEIEIRLEKNHKSSQDKSLSIKQSSEVNSLTLVIDKIILWLYRNTSFHHTCFTRILNFSAYMIFLYGIFLFILTFILSNISLGKVDIFLICGKILIFLVLSAYISYRMKRNDSVLTTILSIFSILFLAAVLIFPMPMDSIPFFIYIIVLVFTTQKYFDIITTKINVSYYFHSLLYIILLVIIVIKPQLLNPFIGIFPSNNLFESKFEQKLNDLNLSAIFNLAKIAQKDFNFQSEYNISFTELNAAKTIILTNQSKLTAIKDENLTKAENILGKALYGEILHTLNYDSILNNAVKSTNILYSIILLLCIFSLQKTARKNSIVPS